MNDTKDLIRLDQLEAIRKSLLVAIPVNLLLGLAVTVVAMRYGRGADALIWFACSAVINGLRGILCFLPVPSSGSSQSLDWHFRLHALAAACSGTAWGAVAVLSDFYTSDQSIFFLTVVAGITAGAVTTGTAYAPVPSLFVIATLSWVIVSLGVQDAFHKQALAATIVLYLIALLLSARQTDRRFRELCRLRHEAHGMAAAERAAHEASAQAAREMQYRATHDDLTGLLNRAGFMQAAEKITVGSGQSVCLMLLDLDGFKTINDTFGHSAGDRVLIEVAHRLRAAVPRDADIARLGGDEFVIIIDFTEAGTEDAPLKLASDLVAAMSEPLPSFPAGHLSISVGTGFVGQEPFDETLRQIDAALYQAKAMGGGSICQVDDWLRRRLSRLGDIERDLLGAIEHSQLEVWYQPIVVTRSETPESMEALLRWSHPLHGWISPEEIIEISRRAGLSDKLLGFIVRQVCSMFALLSAEGHPPLRLSLNISPDEAVHLNVDDLVLDVLHTHGISPALLEIELTEQAFLDLDRIVGKIERLAASGIHIAIDDFGAGHSSLSALQQLPVQRVKIDRGFIRSLATCERSCKLIASVVNLGQLLDIKIVAEGVENREELETVRELGCDFAQGYYFAKPMPPLLAIEWLAQRTNS